MLVLALDTSSAAVTAAVVDADDLRVVGERVTINSRGHGELLAPEIEECLAEADITPRDLGAIVAGTGPGPFTGLRVGLVTAAVLAELLGIPTYGVCSLDAIALPGSTMLVAGDARRREVYWARYVAGVRVEGPSVSSPMDVPPWDGSMAGGGAHLYAEALRGVVPGAVLLDREYPSARQLVLAAVERIRSGAPSEILEPLYLRRPDAEVPHASKAVTP